MKMSLTLLDDTLQSHCRIGVGAETCSYLIYGPDGFQCAKGTGMEALIVARRAAGALRAMGDNCAGPPTYKLTEAE